MGRDARCLIRPLVLVSVLAFVLLAGLAGSASRAAAATAAPATACPDADGDWVASCFERQGDVRRVKPRFLKLLKRLRFNRYGRATVLIADQPELVAVDRKGVVVMANIRFFGDFDNPNPDGVGRFDVKTVDAAGKETWRCGYFREGRFDIVYPPRFDHCEAFVERKALACTGCTMLCGDLDCHATFYVGGNGFSLDVDGKATPSRLPTKDTICGRPEWFHVERTPGDPPLLKCLKGLKDINGLANRIR